MRAEPPDGAASGYAVGVFGFDERQLRRARRRRSRWVLWGLELLSLALWGGVTGGLYLFTTPEGVQRVLNRLVGDAPVVITLEDVEIAPTSELLAPETWEVTAVGVRILPRDHERQETHIARLTVGMPDLVRAWATRVLAFEWARVVGLRIHKKEQRPRDQVWTPRETALDLITARTIEVWDAAYHADPDPPIGSAEVTHIYGELSDVRYAPGARALSGTGTLRCRRLRSGTVDLRRVVVGRVDAVDSDLHLQDGSFRFADAPGSVHGDIEGIFGRARMALTLSMQGADLGQLVRTATGQPSPIDGRLDATFTVHSGGELPRGGSWMQGSIRLTDGRIPLDDSVSDLTHDLLTLVPFLETDDGHLLLGETTGTMLLDRRSVQVLEATYQSPRREAQLLGGVDTDGMEFTLRVVPPRDPETRPGFGVVLSKAHTGPARFRVARRDDLLPFIGGDSPPPDDASSEDAPEAPRRRWRLRDHLPGRASPADAPPDGEDGPPEE